jgi:hypothetical protein
MKTIRSGFAVGVLIMAVFGLGLIWQANENEVNQVRLTSQTVEFCARWMENVECSTWAEGILDEHEQVMERCLELHDLKSIGIYNCVLRGVFE